MLQDLLGNFVPALKKTESWTANIIGTGGCVALWGWLLYQGVVDPLGGINTRGRCSAFPTRCSPASR